EPASAAEGAAGGTSTVVPSRCGRGAEERTSDEPDLIRLNPGSITTCRRQRRCRSHSTAHVPAATSNPGWAPNTTAVRKSGAQAPSPRIPKNTATRMANKTWRGSQTAVTPITSTTKDQTSNHDCRDACTSSSESSDPNCVKLSAGRSSLVPFATLSP